MYSNMTMFGVCSSVAQQERPIEGTHRANITTRVEILHKYQPQPQRCHTQSMLHAANISTLRF